jgi:hypothetical protein
MLLIGVISVPVGYSLYYRRGPYLALGLLLGILLLIIGLALIYLSFLLSTGNFFNTPCGMGGCVTNTVTPDAKVLSIMGGILGLVFLILGAIPILGAVHRQKSSSERRTSGIGNGSPRTMFLFKAAGLLMLLLGVMLMAFSLIAFASMTSLFFIGMVLLAAGYSSYFRKIEYLYFGAALVIIGLIIIFGSLPEIIHPVTCIGICHFDPLILEQAATSSATTGLAIFLIGALLVWHGWPRRKHRSSSKTKIGI